MLANPSELLCPSLLASSKARENVCVTALARKAVRKTLVVASVEKAA